jgi:hypothetical protein
MKRRSNPAMKRRSNKELIVPSEPRRHWLLDDTLRFDGPLTFIATLTKQLRGRERNFQDKNAERQRKAERNYQEYRDIERRLLAEGRASRRTNRDRMAQLIQAELIKDGRLNKDGKPAHTRTIKRAFSPKNKV